MISPEGTIIRRTLVKDVIRPGVSLEEERCEWEVYAGAQQLPNGIEVRAEVIAGVACSRVTHASHSGPELIIYIHGGGLISGSALTHREFAARLTKHTRKAVLLIDYRLAPEYPFPAALEDVESVYLELIRCGISSRRVFLGGDSSGAGLALAALVKLKADAHPVPAGAFLISGHFDMTLSGESLVSRRDVDPVTTPESLARAATLYTNGADLASPLVSPLFADLRGLPRLLIQVGEHEILLSDSTRLADLVAQCGGSADLRIWNEMWHVWHMTGDFPEARGALDEIGMFMERVMMSDG
jgi:monoterpene epsilon-lactone hydrolase